jgi:hypothetical protein
MAGRRYPDIGADPKDDPRDSGDRVPADENENPVDYLRVQRLTLETKCDGLDAEQMARRDPHERTDRGTHVEMPGRPAGPL